MFLKKLPSINIVKKVLGTFSDEKKNEESFDIELLNSHRCIKCAYCNELIMLANHTPLSMENCEHCLSTNFIPALIKHYWLVQPLGGGGMGCVYQAIHQNDQNLKYAIKILQKDGRGTRFFIETLLREAHIGKELGKHPHIVEVIDYGHFDNHFFSLMPYTSGKRLDLLINSPETISNAYILLWVLQILAAEKHIYEHGYLFRDLKPENIIITFSGNVKVFDFGLTLPIEEATNANTNVVDGSPYYIPPERIFGKPEDLRSEIYSLGMIMFHLFTRKPYYKGKVASDIILQHTKGENLKKIREKMPEHVPDVISDIIQKMTAKIPSARYQSIDSLASDIMKVYKSCFKTKSTKINANTKK